MAASVGVLAISVGMAAAQNGWNRNYDRYTVDRTEYGRGTVHVMGRDFNINGVRVNLQRGGRATITALKQGNDVTFTGRWSPNSVRANIVALTFDRVSYQGRESDRVDARGRVMLTGNQRVQQVEIGGRNVSDRNDVRLTFRARGRGNGWDDRDNRGRDDDEDNNGGLSDHQISGRYTDYEHWGRNGDSFQLQYSLDLSEQSHRARLVASSKDRNMPNDATDRERHGDILSYLHTGQDVIQTGNWHVEGNRVIIDLDRIEYGRTSRSKSERLVGDLRGTSIYITTWDRAFYGRDVRMTFERS